MAGDVREEIERLTGCPVEGPEYRYWPARATVMVRDPGARYQVVGGHQMPMVGTGQDRVQAEDAGRWIILCTGCGGWWRGEARRVPDPGGSRQPAGCSGVGAVGSATRIQDAQRRAIEALQELLMETRPGAVDVRVDVVTAAGDGLGWPLVYPDASTPAGQGRRDPTERNRPIGQWLLGARLVDEWLYSGRLEDMRATRRVAWRAHLHYAGPAAIREVQETARTYQTEGEAREAAYDLLRGILAAGVEAIERWERGWRGN